MHPGKIKKKYGIIIVAIATVLLVAYLSYQPDARKSIFTERLGDMTLIRYESGEAAAREIFNISVLKDVPFAEGYFAVYTGKNGTMRIWVLEIDDHNIAYNAFNAMHSELIASTGHGFPDNLGQRESYSRSGENTGTTGFTRPMKVDIPDLLKPEVYLIKADTLYIYYYLKMDYKKGRVYWITFDYPDTGYQKAMVIQTILKI